MEGCSEVFTFLLLASLLLASIVGAMAYASLRRRLDELTKRIAALEAAGGGGETQRPQPDRADLPAAAGVPAPAPTGAETSPPIAPAPPRRPEPHSPGPLDAGPPPAVLPPPEPPTTESVPSEPPPERASAEAPPDEPRRTADWERWIGVRGAAVLGGIVLSIAGLLFLQYTIEAGWFTPEVRVVVASAVGLAALGVSPLQRRRGYTAVSEALAGAGVVLLYGALWAGHVLYGLFAALPAFAGLVAVTAVCGWIAWRHGSRIVAILGLMGGFAAPLILSAPVEDPLGLFGYLLLLNVGLWLVARRRGWGDLGLVAVVATAAYEMWWVEAWLPRYGLGWPILVLAGFGLLWAAAGELDRRRGGARSWTAVQLLGVALPALLGFRLASALGAGIDLWKLGAYLAVLSFAGDRVAAVRGFRAFAIALAALGVGVLAATGDLELGAWSRVGTSALLAAVFHLGFELDRRRGRIIAAAGGDPALVATLGHLALLVALATVVEVAALAPWLVGWSVVAALLARQAAVSGGEWRTPTAATLVGLGLTLLFVEHRWAEVPAAALALGGLAALLTRVRRSDDGRRAAWLAAAIVPAFALFALWAEGYAPTLGPWVFVGAGLALAILVAVAATALGSAPLYTLGLALLAFGHWAWIVHRSPDGQAIAPALLLAAFLVPAVAFTLWPCLATRLRPPGLVLAVAAAAPPAWALPVVWTWQDAYGRAWDGVPALALAAVSALGLATAVRRRDDEDLRETARTWFPVFGTGLVAAAVALQLEREWLTIGWATLAVVLLAGWRRLGWEVLRAWALVLFAGVAVRLVLNPWVVGYHGTEGLPILNWLAWTYLLPAAALLAGHRLLAGRDPEPRGASAAAAACGLAAVLVVFWWLNLTVVEIFSAGPALDLSLGYRPARDLTLSAAWILYALGLLALGLARRSRALRWLSLAFLVLAILKVFLYDLGELRDLWRVASLVGLALCLLTVSLVYQRFVFGREKGDTGYRIEKRGTVAVAVPTQPVPPVTAEEVEEARREIREERARRHERRPPSEDS